MDACLVLTMFFAPGFGLVQLESFLCVREPAVRGQPSERPEHNFKLKNQHEVNQLLSFGLVTEKPMTQNTGCSKQYLEWTYLRLHPPKLESGPEPTE